MPVGKLVPTQVMAFVDDQVMFGLLLNGIGLEAAEMVAVGRGIAVKVAVTLTFAFGMRTPQVPVPGQLTCELDQPLKTKPAAGVAVSVVV